MVCEFENSHTPRAKEQVGQDRTPRPCPFVLRFGAFSRLPEAREIPEVNAARIHSASHSAEPGHTANEVIE